MKTGFSKNLRYLSALILWVFLLGTLVSLFPMVSFALSPFDEEAKLLEEADRIDLYLDASNVFESKEDKLATMEHRLTVSGYELYADESTGEVAVRNQLTGQILTTNPYDVASVPDSYKQAMMSQIELSFVNIQDGKTTELKSFNEAARRGQITVKNIRNGIRVEYTLGRVTSKQLIPGAMEYNRFLEVIEKPALENCYTEAEWEAYKEQNPNTRLTLESMRNTRYNRLIGSNYQDIIYDDKTPDRQALLLKTYKNLDKYPAYADYDGDGVLDWIRFKAINPNLSERNRNAIESAVKQYTTYTFEDLQSDLDFTGYEAEDDTNAVFELALEYTLSADGLEVRLPAKSIRYNEQRYRLGPVKVLTYFGASSNDFEGYTFIPDGSGTIIRNEDTLTAASSQPRLSWKVYGPDFTYHSMTNQNQFNGQSEILRMPVFGVIEKTIMRTYNLEHRTGYVWVENEVKDSNGATVYYTETDRIMIDAVDANGNLYRTLEDYLAKFRYDTANPDAAPVQSDSALWENPTYAPVDTLERYNAYVEAGYVPYIEVISFYLMAPAVDEEGNPITYKGHQVYVYVDAEGNVVEEEDRVEGVLKIKEQLWYNGKPAYYNSDVPLDPNAVIPPAGEGGEGSDGGEGGEGTETPPEATDPGAGEGGEGGETPPEEDTPSEGGDDTEEDLPEIKYYNDVPKVEEKYDEIAYEEFETVVPQGFFAIITAGDALCSITSDHGIQNHKYNSVYITVFPRPQDSYRLADAVSVSNDAAEWTVTSDRKYTGDYRIKYFMLTDATYVEKDGSGRDVIRSWPYEASYVGMAEIYREYLEKTGVLTALTASDVDDDIPLYLEALGMTTTTKVVATIPMMVDMPLTTFEDLATMYDRLAEKGVDNVNFKLTGFGKGGLYAYAPSTLKFESVVGGNSGYQDMVAYCNEISSQTGKQLAIYPDFDFVNIARLGGFDSFSPLDDAVRTIDDRYASKRYYDATYQSFLYDFSTMVSPSVFMTLFEKFSKKMDKLGFSGVAVSTLGAELNSDFDSDDPYNREDSKRLTVDVLKALSDKYGKVMVDGGNAFALPYVSHILNMSLDSSKYTLSSAAVPFMGMVLHGYVSYAGTPTGMASDIHREILKIIENGAAPFFTVAYQNTSVLKDDFDYNHYYSIDFEISFDEIVEQYTRLNEALADLQTARITGHEFLDGIRQLNDNEKAEVAAMMADGRENFEQAVADARKAYNNRKALAERHGEEFTEVFEETYSYLDTPDHYAEHILEEYEASLNREISAKSSFLVMVEYTRQDGSKKVFILNYAAYDASVTYEGTVYDIPVGGFAVIDR